MRMLSEIVRMGRCTSTFDLYGQRMVGGEGTHAVHGEAHGAGTSGGRRSRAGQRFGGKSSGGSRAPAQRPLDSGVLKFATSVMEAPDVAPASPGPRPLLLRLLRAVKSAVTT